MTTVLGEQRTTPQASAVTTWPGSLPEHLTLTATVTHPSDLGLAPDQEPEDDKPEDDDPEEEIFHDAPSFQLRPGQISQGTQTDDGPNDGIDSQPQTRLSASDFSILTGTLKGPHDPLYPPRRARKHIKRRPLPGTEAASVLSSPTTSLADRGNTPVSDFASGPRPTLSGPRWPPGWDSGSVISLDQGPGTFNFSRQSQNCSREDIQGGNETSRSAGGWPSVSRVTHRWANPISYANKAFTYLRNKSSIALGKASSMWKSDRNPFNASSVSSIWHSKFSGRFSKLPTWLQTPMYRAKRVNPASPVTRGINPKGRGRGWRRKGHVTTTKSGSMKGTKGDHSSVQNHLILPI